jgi:hypothetical protein
MYDGTVADAQTQLYGQIGIMVAGGIEPFSAITTIGLGKIIDALQGTDYFYTGCKWVTDGKANLEEYEKLLNVW